MKSRNQYLYSLIFNNGGYHLKSKKEKTRILNRYCQVTGQNRKHVIRKIKKGTYIISERKRKRGKQRHRKSYYDRYVTIALIRCWKIFDHPCGQRLEALLKDEIDRLKRDRELLCSDEIANKLKRITARTIDEKLKPYKEKCRVKRFYDYKNNPLLYEKIPIKLSTDWNRKQAGNIQIDLVEHCGRSNYGEYIRTFSSTDIATGWWEGNAQLTKSMKATINSLKKIQKRYPVKWNAIHSDNGSEFINWQLYEYTRKNKLEFTRSRIYHKNDNCFVEQKNSTHVRRCVGHYRYDTKKELNLLNDLYANELHLYKNFFQPIMKLISKERIGGHLKRKYDKAKTPYKRMMASNEIDQATKEELKKIYESLNPAEIKRRIDSKLKLLKKMYGAKQYHSKVLNKEDLKINTVTSLNCTTGPISVA